MRLIITLLVVTLPAMALAHPGPHSHPHGESAPLLSLDHLIPVLGVALAVALYRLYRARS